MYLIFKKEDSNTLEVKRKSDATIEVVAGRFILKEK